MGRLIEESRVVEILQQTWLSGTIAHRFIDDIKRRIRIEVPTVEAIPKADYETRLKTDIAAVLDKIRAEIEQLPTNTRINWDGCCPDIDYPEIEYVDVSKAGLLEIINKYKAESEG